MAFPLRNVRTDESGDRLCRRPRTAWIWQLSRVLAMPAIGITGIGLLVAAAAGNIRLPDHVSRILPRSIRNAFSASYVNPVQMQSVTEAVRRAGPPSSDVAGQPRTFGIGSSEEDVRRLQGSPGRVQGSTWFYGRSQVHFVSGRVVAWTHSSSSPLRVR